MIQKLAAGLAFSALSLLSGLAGESKPTDRLRSVSNAGRVGVVIRDADNKIRNVRQGDERFLMCSTFKFLAVAAVLHRVDRGEDQLDRFIKYTAADILEWAPITKQHLNDGGMTLEALCFAAIAYSDNTAANLILQTLGGPAGLTDYARSLGDDVTRLDRTEPELNNGSPGDERDTTTPMAMLRDMEKILLGDAVSVQAREKLEGWMVQSTTGDALIRAGVPRDWRVGDKSGRNATSNTNDIAIVRRPDGRTILLCIYIEVPGQSSDQRAKIIADVTRELLSQ